MNGSQRNAHYTFRYNQSSGRHGWLRLTPAYSVRMMERILEGLDYRPARVLEPFSGTGTTALVCANAGIAAAAYDVNPFLVWLARTKTTVYSEKTAGQFQDAAGEIAEHIASVVPCACPPIFNIGRWWNPGQLDYLARLKSAVWKADPQVRDLLKVAFCRQIIGLSNAAFNHVSTSFQTDGGRAAFSDEEGNAMFLASCGLIADTLAVQPQTAADIQEHNSMSLPAEMAGRYDTVITSPPYPNRISYIRELRPYMYWLEYLRSPDDASELDWETIGGTWGAATSRLSAWKRKTDLLSPYLLEIAGNIARADNKSAGLMANYVLKYFDDMATHIQSVYGTIRDGGTVHYIVGNSSFYGNTVPSDEIYRSILANVGFHDTKSVVVRKRNCNKALYEYWISARK